MTSALRNLGLAAASMAVCALAQASVVVPPLTASLLAVCQGQPCVRTPPPALVNQARSRKPLMRRST